MSKKIMLLAIASSVVMVVVAPGASAEEIHLEPGNGESFVFSGVALTASAEGEPTVTCEGVGGNGQFDTGSSTTGAMVRDYTGCHIKIPIFGTTAKCRSEGSAVDNTVLTSGTFHLITWKNSKGEAFPAILMTTDPVVVICAGISKISFTGSVIGTITSPKCGGSSKELTLSLTTTNNIQDHLLYTGVSHDLQMKTGEGELRTASIAGSATVSSVNAQKLTCT